MTRAYVTRCFDQFADRIAVGLMRKRRWTPVDKRLAIVVEGSDDVKVGGVRRNAVIRGYDVSEKGTLTRLLVQLESPIYYCGRFAAPRRPPVIENEIEWLVVTPSPGSPPASRLLFFCWWRGRIADAPSFAASTALQPFGTARLRMRLWLIRR